MISQLIDTAIIVFTIGIPECIVLTVLVLALLRLDSAKIREIVITGVSLAAAVLIIRLAVQSTGIPGIHTTVSLLTLALIVARYYRVSKVHSVIACMVAMLLLAVTELLSYKLAAEISGMDVASLVQHRLYWIFTNWLHIAFLALITAVITRTGWYRQKKNINGSLKNFRAR